MDSKNIYISCNVMMRKVEWEKSADGDEWIYIGSADDFRLKEVQNKINGFFSEENLFLVIDRHISKEITKEIAAEAVKNNLNKNEIKLCEKDFKKFMTFSYIGVMRQGKYSS